MTGLKYKLAHRRAEKEKWNATDNIQRKRLIQILQELIDQLKKEMVETTR
jgi:acyl-CoA reductase-like NAD-dependent aldehyde dehydrogenase